MTNLLANLTLVERDFWVPEPSLFDNPGDEVLDFEPHCIQLADQEPCHPVQSQVDAENNKNQP